MNKEDKIKDLETQARNTKHLMDELNIAYLGMTTEELIKLALKGAGGGTSDDRNDDSCTGCTGHAGHGHKSITADDP